jgi:hypothetical protein
MMVGLYYAMHYYYSDPFPSYSIPVTKQRFRIWITFRHLAKRRFLSYKSSNTRKATFQSPSTASLSTQTVLQNIQHQVGEFSVRFTHSWK